MAQIIDLTASVGDKYIQKFMGSVCSFQTCNKFVVTKHYKNLKEKRMNLHHDFMVLKFLDQRV